MTAPETAPTAEHTDAVAVEFEHVVVGSGYYAMNIGTSAACEAARAILTSSNPETHEALAANLPADVMLDALVRAGVLTEHTFQSFGGKWTLTLSTEPRAIDQDEALDLLRKRLTGEVSP